MRTPHKYTHVLYACRSSLLLCDVCGKPAGDPIHLLTFAGMEAAVEAQAQAAAVYSGQELTAKLLEPLGSIDSKAARMEEDSPLFFGKVNATLF